ncbi:MAG: CHASE2 domain-containing protein [Desulfobacterium sp.]|nr:CHASE2 domain-containing protein [Desulfobacterium sp.]MBU3949445.1 CHASE2 domain-containing protein [Pseudomonadota bacterium]MBU4035936.1 CHASE2 domain-containing protein [Pseudomonadota bacterium]
MKEQDSSIQAIGLTKKILLTGLVISLFIVAAYLIYPRFIRSINNRSTDIIMAFSEKKAASGSVVVVDIDEKSLAEYGQWPWPRYRLSQLLQKIAETGATSIALDMILAEPDRTSPVNWQISVGHEREYPVDLSGSIPAETLDHDRCLADTFSKGPYVLGYEFLFKNNSKPNTECRLHPFRVVRMNRPDKGERQPGFFTANGVVCNLRLFSDAIKYSGFLNATPDSDGVLRRVPLVIRFEGQLFPSLALASLMQWKNSDRIDIIKTKGGFLNLNICGVSIPVDRQGNMILNFSKSATTPQVSAGDILVGNVLPGYFKDKIVLVGSTASGLDHTYQTPTNPVYSHVDLHAQILENLISGQSVFRPREFLLWEAILGLILAILICLTIAKMGILASAVVAGAAISGIWIGTGLLFRAYGCLLSPLLPTVLIVSNYTVLTILKEWKNHLAAREKAGNALVLLKSSEKELNSIIKSVPDIIFRLDSEGRITFLSPAVSKYISSPEHLIGQPIFNLVAPNDLQKVKYRINEKRTGSRATYGLEVRLLLPHKKDGTIEEEGYFSVSAEGIYRNETPCSAEFIGTQGIIRDITEQKKLEERLLHAKKMETIGNLAAGVAHDLNNILTGLVSYPDLLLLELPEGSPMRKKIAVIQKSGQKAAAIVQDLLTLARRGVKVSKPVNMNNVISDYIISPEYNAANKFHPGVILETDLASDLMNVKGSRVHLSKAIMNILNNAAEAMPAGGHIRLSSYNRYLDISLNLYEEIPAGEYVCISVADEGVGIADEDLEKIFEPFYSKKSMKRSGSGLGMTVVWATVKDHKGYIDLKSTEGEGTRIVLYLPATRESEEIDSHRIVLEEYLGTERVLIVDDMPEQVQIASNMLSKLGYKVDTVGSGEAAVEYMQKNQADLIVLDMVMPGGLDGLETYQRIIEIHPRQKAIIASGFSESDRVKALQALGAGAYISKPYTLEKIGVAVRKELDRRRI